MSDFVKIRVTYPNQEMDAQESLDSDQGAKVSSGTGAGQHSRRLGGVAFAAVGAVVFLTAIGAGLFYTNVYGPSSPALMAAASSPSANDAEDAGVPPAEAEMAGAVLSGENVGDAEPTDTVSDESLDRFETGGSDPSREMATLSAGSGSPAGITELTPETPTPDTRPPESSRPDSALAAISPPVKPDSSPQRILNPAFVNMPLPAKRPFTTGREPDLSAPDPNTAGGVARSQLTSAVRGREPVDQLSSPVKLGDSGGRTLYYFTELKGLSGETVFHRWEHDGQTMVTLRIEIGGDRWRAYSSKTIPASQRGDWRVVVANAQGDVLASAKFVAE